MSYNVPNILIDGLVLPNKPLSNLEVNDQNPALEEYYCKIVFLEKHRKTIAVF